MAKRRKYSVLFIMVLLFLVPFLWSSQNLYNLGGDDSRLYFYTPSNWLKNIAAYSWFEYFGTYNPQHAYAPLNIFSLALKHLFPFLNLQKMLYGLILSLGFLMTFLTLKELLNTKEEASYYAAILGGLAYIFSPLLYYTQWVVPLGSILGIAGYPAIFFFFLKAIRQEKVKYLIYGSLVSLVFSIAISSAPWTFVFLIGTFIFFAIYLILSKSQLKLIMKYGVIYILLFVLINSLWFLSWTSSLVSTNLQATHALSTLGKEGGIRVVNAVAGSMNIFDTLMNLLSRGIVYNFGWPQIKIAKYTYRLAPLSVFLPIIIFLPLLLRKKKENISVFKFWLALAITTILLAYLQTVNVSRMGINFFNLLIKYFPGWVMLKNFYHKVPITYVFFYSLTLGVSLYVVPKNISKVLIKKIIFLTVLLIIILQAFPFIRGDIANLPFCPDADVTMNVDIPPYYTDAIKTIDKLKEGKVLSLPFTMASWSFFKSKGNNGMYIGLSPILVFTGKNDFNGIYAFNNGERFIPGLISMVKEAMQNRDCKFLGKLFGLLNLRYIVYNSEIYEDKTLKKVGEHYIWGFDDFQTKDNTERLVKAISDKKIGKFGPINVYELSSKYYYPTIYATNKVISIDKETFVPLTLRHMKYLDEKPVFLFNQQIEENPELKVQSPKKGPEVEFRRVNLTRYIVRAKASEPFWLVFSESYHPGWRAYIRPVRSSEFASRPEGTRGPRGRVRREKDKFEWSALVSVWRDRGKRIELKEHFMVNGYANGWYIPVDQLARLPVSQLINQPTKQAISDERRATNEMEIVLEFVPQRLFEIGVLISGLTLLGCVGYLVGTGVRKRKGAGEKVRK